MKQQRSIIKSGRDCTDRIGVAHFVPNRNRPAGRARMPKVKPVYQAIAGKYGKVRTRIARIDVIGFKSPSTGDLEKQTNNSPATNTEVIREAKQLGTFVDHPARLHRHAIV
jgi:hypothetical protein